MSDLYPLGSPSLYGGVTDKILVTFDVTTPGLAFNSQPPKYAKWVFEHEERLQYHPKDGIISKKIDDIAAKIPELADCFFRHAETDAYGWFNAYAIPGWGERFKKNEQVHNGMRV